MIPFTQTRTIPKAVVAVTLLAALSTECVYAQIATWTNPVSGFYETPTNWTPTGIPESTDVVRFDKAGDYDIGFQGLAGAGGLLVENDADIDFIVAGADINNRVFRVHGDAVVEDARLRLLGNDAGPTISLVLTNNIDLRGGTNALQIVGNSVVLNESTLIDVSGTIPVTGTMARWNMSGGLTVRGAGQLAVTGGGLASSAANAVLGGTSSDDMGNGFLLLSGVGDDGQPSTFIGGDDLIAGSYGTSRVTVEDGAFMDIADRVRVAFGAGSDGTITVEGVDALNNPSTLNTGLMTMGSGGDAELNVLDGGLVNSDSATVGDSTGAVARVSGSAGNTPSTWNITTSLRVGATGSGRMSVGQGGQVTTNRTLIGLGSGTALVFVADPNTTWQNTESMYVGGNETQALASGVFEVSDDARADIGGTLRIWDGGTVRVRIDGRMAVDTIDHTHGGTFQLTDGGTLHVNRFEGSLLNPSGILAPGADDDAGATLITGDYTQQTGAILSLGIGGTSPGGTHDLVNIVGDADIDGDLELKLIENFTPNPTDEFLVLASGNLFGFFDNVATGQRLDTIDGRGSFVVNYGIGSTFDATQIVLSNFEAAASVPGDFDFDRDVDGRDFLAWQRIDGTPGGLNSWQSNYGTQASPASAVSAVPEPASLVLGIFAALAMTCRRQP